RMPRPSRPPPTRLDSETLKYARDVLTDRLRAVETYGAGGCPSCHDAELRGAIAKLRELAEATKS
ncbi:MAG TPA: hypothetical protein VMK12_16505, partial [Anaeromyxobacteraceae bacterium]|nr:hypothetical protein [Anaeromyxobacteraceae bacterium]